MRRYRQKLKDNSAKYDEMKKKTGKENRQIERLKKKNE